MMEEAEGSREAVAAVDNVPDEGVTADPDQEVSEPGTPKKQHKVVADRSEVRVELVYSNESDAAAAAEQSSSNGKITQV